MTWRNVGNWLVSLGRFIGNLYALIVVFVLGSLALTGLFFVIPALNHADLQTQGVLGLIGLVLFGFFLSFLARQIGPDLVVVYKKIRDHNVDDSPVVVTTADGATRPIDE